MPTSPTTNSPTVARVPLRLELHDDATNKLHGTWWPQSRNLQDEAADLVDHFPPAPGRIDRLLFSRPDWDNPTKDGRGVRLIQAQRGPVKVGSFPSDDTRLMVLTMASGRRLRLVVVPSDVEVAEGERRMRSAAEERPPSLD
ncbi:MULTISPECIES: DUF5994 family protein [unclassified Nocardioides]|uniref:DUF5994 family protein n=1 Tax=unclassified Nocardioides TaxID=2615069 RepID=UPI003605B5E6